MLFLYFLFDNFFLQIFKINFVVYIFISILVDYLFLLVFFVCIVLIKNSSWEMMPLQLAEIEQNYFLCYFISVNVYFISSHIAEKYKVT